MSRKILLITIFLFLLLMAGCSEPYQSQNIGDYIGREYVAIESKTGNLNVVTIEMYSSEYEAGCIIYQDPYPKKEYKQGDKLTLYVSAGAPTKELDVAGLSVPEAEERLESQEICYSIKCLSNLWVNEDAVIGLGNNEGQYILYVSKGQPDIKVSGQQGYVVKAGGSIIYLDNHHICRMNLDGTNKEKLLEAEDIKLITAYDDWIVFRNEASGVMRCFNIVDQRSYVTNNTKKIIGVVEDKVVFIMGDTLKSKSLISGVESCIEKGNVFDGYIYKNKLLILKRYSKDEEAKSDIISFDFFTGERQEVIVDHKAIGAIYIEAETVYFSSFYDIYSMDVLSGEATKVLDNDDFDYLVYDNNLVYETDTFKINIKDINTKQDVELCQGDGCLFGLDKSSDWYYFYHDKATYRMKSDGSKKEYFCDEILSPGVYIYNERIFMYTDGIVFIDDWIYYLNIDQILCRININTKEIEQIAEQSVDMPWWTQI